MMRTHCRITCLLAVFVCLWLGIPRALAEQNIGTRQIHLDFHTSEHLPDIGKRFSKKQFQQALQAAHVNAINIFAKGHHSWSYYPTRVGHRHPNLDFDLLGAQIEACHEIDVQCPIYFTVGWSHMDAMRHPEWCGRNRDGTLLTTGPYDPAADPATPKPSFHWINMRVNTPYHDHIMAQAQEICEGYDKLPIQSKYFLEAGYPVTAMSGKFHTSWGEFGGFKHPNAIKYEAAFMIAWGAHCNFGDQLHPCGEMDMATYENIGHAYAYIEKIEPPANARSPCLACSVTARLCWDIRCCQKRVAG